MTEQEIVMMAAEVAAKAAVAAVRAILGKEIQESVEAAVTDAARLPPENHADNDAHRNDSYRSRERHSVRAGGRLYRR